MGITREDKISFNECFCNDSSEGKPMSLQTFFKILVDAEILRSEPSPLDGLTWSPRTKPLTNEEIDIFISKGWTMEEIANVIK